MKKLFFIALFAIGLTTTTSAQCGTPPSNCVADYCANNLAEVDEAIDGVAVTITFPGGTPTAGVDNGSSYTEDLNLIYTIGGIGMYEVEVFAGQDSYYFIAEINTTTNKITSYDICEQ